ncbi:hypothetical protein WN55_00868 [Dufourea novaeangliae]|uniref:Uncharacterized protein n=1 Tax=Dufourea novaeangliae TaxID=178035 RepID=A0A154PD34_DUFNO|nr:hypothetical protein WN55_00868 [Dufourea novaeangliae]
MRPVSEIASDTIRNLAYGGDQLTGIFSDDLYSYRAAGLISAGRRLVESTCLKMKLAGLTGSAGGRISVPVVGWTGVDQALASDGSCILREKAKFGLSIPRRTSSSSGWPPTEVNPGNDLWQCSSHFRFPQTAVGPGIRLLVNSSAHSPCAGLSRSPTQKSKSIGEERLSNSLELSDFEVVECTTRGYELISSSGRDFSQRQIVSTKIREEVRRADDQIGGYRRARPINGLLSPLCTCDNEVN